MFCNVENCSHLTPGPHLTSSRKRRMPLPRYSTIFSGWAGEEAAAPAAACCPAVAAAVAAAEACSPRQAAGAVQLRNWHRSDDPAAVDALSRPFATTGTPVKCGTSCCKAAALPSGAPAAPTCCAASSRAISPRLRSIAERGRFGFDAPEAVEAVGLADSNGLLLRCAYRCRLGVELRHGAPGALPLCGA